MRCWSFFVPVHWRTPPLPSPVPMRHPMADFAQRKILHGVGSVVGGGLVAEQGLKGLGGRVARACCPEAGGVELLAREHGDQRVGG